MSREEVLDNCRLIAAATDLPVNADLENGYADEPRAAAEMIRLASEAGIVGGSIEDATGDPQKPIYDFALAVERVQAAVETGRSLPVPFVLTARAENLLHGRLTSTTRSGDCRPSKRPARTCCTRRGFATSRRCAPSSAR